MQQYEVVEMPRKPFQRKEYQVSTTDGTFLFHNLDKELAELIVARLNTGMTLDEVFEEQPR